MRLVHRSTHFQLDLVEYELILSDQLNVRGLIEAHFEDSYQSFHNNIYVSKNIEVEFVEKPRSCRLIFQNGSITINENSLANLCRLEPAINKTMVRLQKLVAPTTLFLVSLIAFLTARFIGGVST